MGIKLLFGVFYRPPNTDIQYLRSLRSSLDRVNNTKAEKIFLVGDFNLPNFDWTNQLPCSFELIYIETFEMLNDAFLTQVNTEPTRNDNRPYSVARYHSIPLPWFGHYFETR